LPDGSAVPGLGRIVTASMVFGLLSAIVLAVLLFGGAPENVIWGVVLVGFALGWAALAAGSTMWTASPQRWAWLPAATLALAGIALLAWPRAVEKEWVAWGWPLATIALAVTTLVRARRHLRGRAAWPVQAVFAMMTLAAIAGLVECTLEAHDRRVLPMPGRRVDVGGRQLYMTTAGDGGPTVVLFCGFGDRSSEWGWIAPAVAKDSRVCAFDLAGRGWSDSAPAMQDGEAIATDAHTLLERANIPGPYVLAGHSLGGLYAMIFAARHPADVAGMVLLDSTHPQQYTRLAPYPRLYEIYRRGSALFPSLARLGVGRIVYRSQFDALPAAVRAEQVAFWSTARFARSQRDEWAGALHTMDEARALRSLGNRPLAVVTAVRGAPVGWMPLQDELARLSTNSVHRVMTQAEHSELVYLREPAAASAQAIREVVQAVRTRRPLTQH
jgi:pimeloyl-ACP methyl ester carboxylesterase